MLDLVRVIRKKVKSYKIKITGKIQDKKPFITLIIYCNKSQNTNDIMNHHKEWIEKTAVKMFNKINNNIKANDALLQHILENKTLKIFNVSYDISALNTKILKDILYQKSIELLDFYAAKMNVKYSALTIKNVKSFFGKCDRNNKITIAFSMILEDIDILKYLIVHELAHVKYKNHSTAFWNLVESFCENAKEKRRTMKKNSMINTMILEHYNLI